MRISLVPLLPIAGWMLLLAACGGARETAAPVPKPPSPEGGRAIEITANDRMAYNVTEIRAQPGEKLSVTLVNVGSMPRQTMGHNWVLLTLDADPVAFVNAAAQAADSNYFPAGFAHQVIAHTRLLGPKERDTVTFDAPTTPGRYVYLCSFPGHFQVGMKGVLVVP